MDKEPALHTAEDASPRELWGSSWRLLLTLAALGLLVVPLIREFPLGQSTRTALLAWLLVGLALYWLYAGMGYRPLLLLQLMLFSTAAALLSAKLLLVVIDINRAHCAPLHRPRFDPGGCRVRDRESRSHADRALAPVAGPRVPREPAPTLSDCG